MSQPVQNSFNQFQNNDQRFYTNPSIRDNLPQDRNEKPNNYPQSSNVNPTDPHFRGNFNTHNNFNRDQRRPSGNHHNPMHTG